MPELKLPKTLTTPDGGKGELNKDHFRNWVPGAVIQIDPEWNSNLGGSFLQVTERCLWGVKGIVTVPGSEFPWNCRLPWEGGRFVGFAEFVLPEDKDDDDDDDLG